MNNYLQKPILGCIADDFTGASDLASFLVNSGLKTVQINRFPLDSELELEGYDAIVVALKTRTVDASDAVETSLAALYWLQGLGCRKYYFKYCSTFDSTPKGNIGPVIDALLDALKLSSTIICPALPVNDRTVYMGHLFVGDAPLNESPLKDHPLTPMQDSSVVRLIEAQGRGKAVNIPYHCIEGDEVYFKAALRAAAKNYRYIVLDTLSTEHLERIGRNVDAFPLITGGSGLATNLTHEFAQYGWVANSVKNTTQQTDGPTLILSGSCSAMTQRQVADYKQAHPALYIDPFKLLNQSQTYEQILAWALQNKSAAPLIYTTSSKEVVDKVQSEIGFEKSQVLLEGTLAKLAEDCIKAGFKNIIVAGGETSGAIVKRLDIPAFEIGQSVSPGVPILHSITPPIINLALKSGNFGDQTFFQSALEKLTCR
ncbi:MULTISPECIES: 3-oxo-tetronate kinase [Aliiglaciecola]|uniref:3-oxo-tetronate kinase n=1 Tax=Aliiglaciecola TaxID=1406885 RepID=UPI001C081E3D|nr:MULTISPECIES: 3-oxo-tetronate kinase [Aliiglaciecola]MBU2879901.1 four-carbon acid sugar kinase family protein [Aliiglaciecola lipolytica]MDO6712415.1 four-carbon acid sugar kinase family protein [Aliiglaciecola sp. 2_MG-2023]MDO6753409.1 four-carbon acid sugar kinase family protein [Aliiglaciecola sp. 1_MG-2023]